MPRWSIALLLVPAVLGCRRNPPELVSTPTVDSASVALARAVADSLGDELMGMLSRAMEKGGPALAIHFCADSAQARTLRHWKNGIYIRRVSRHVRNVADAPDAIERQLLVRISQLKDEGKLPRELVDVMRAPDGTYELQYMRPILVERSCLACHGDPTALSPKVRAEIALRYPHDEAMRYQVGDLRGAVSVRVPLVSPRP